MFRYRVVMDCYTTAYSIEVWADSKAKATYKAYTMWRGKELNEECSFGDFIKLLHQETILLEE